MVTSYYIMKLSKQHQKLEIEDYYSSIFENTRPTSGNKCRICLRDGSVLIHGNDETPGLAEALSALTDVDICEDDEYPKHLCRVCYKFLRRAILFRKTAKLTDEILRNRVKLENNINLDEEHGFDETGFSDQSPPKLNNIKQTSPKKPALPKEKPPAKVICKICKKIYERNYYYKCHLTMHDPNHEKRYVCEVCGKRFRLRNMYDGHRKVHQSDFPFKCNQCPYGARYSHVLKLHMTTHTDEFKYACSECPAQFHFVSNMNIHILKKHREPKFKCKSCDKMFHRQLAMQRHFEANHLGHRNHVCNICGKAFGYRRAMMKHQRGVHKREKLKSGVTPAYLRDEKDNISDNAACSSQLNPTP